MVSTFPGSTNATKIGFWLDVCVSVCQHVCLSICRFVCLSTCQLVCLSVCQCVSCVSVCMSVAPSIVRPAPYRHGTHN